MVLPSPLSVQAAQFSVAPGETSEQVLPPGCQQAPRPSAWPSTAAPNQLGPPDLSPSLGQENLLTQSC